MRQMDFNALGIQIGPNAVLGAFFVQEYFQLFHHLWERGILSSSCSCNGQTLALHCIWNVLMCALRSDARTWTVLSSQHQVRARQKGARKTDRSDGKAAREKGKKFRAPLPSGFQFPLTREPFYSRINMLYFSMLNAFTLVRLATVILC